MLISQSMKTHLCGTFHALAASQGALRDNPFKQYIIYKQAIIDEEFRKLLHYVQIITRKKTFGFKEKVTQ